MPKASKPSTITSRRAIPYPPAATPVIAPALTPIMETDRAISPPRAGADRPGPHTWVSEDDEKLMDARKQGLNWQPIAARYFPDKTPNACRKRHERLMEKRNAADNWNGVKIEAMAKAYMELREQMWTILAEQVGERWQTVETKVCNYPSA